MSKGFCICVRCRLPLNHEGPSWLCPRCMACELGQTLSDTQRLILTDVDTAMTDTLVGLLKRGDDRYHSDRIIADVFRVLGLQKAATTWMAVESFKNSALALPRWRWHSMPGSVLIWQNPAFRMARELPNRCSRT